jgi:hypothetical protein
MPDLINKDVETVKSFFEYRGIKYRVERDVYEGLKEGLIVRQQPLSGFPLRKQEIVTVWVNRKQALGIF